MTSFHRMLPPLGIFTDTAWRSVVALHTTPLRSNQTPSLGKICLAQEHVRNMASEARLYTFSPDTKDKLRKFRLGTSRAKDPQAVVYQIDKKTLEIAPASPDVYTNLQDLADALPDHSPRFVLLSYPLTLPSGRLSVPYVMLNYLPETCNAELKMLYAGAKELLRNTAEVNRIIEIGSEEEVEEIEERLTAMADEGGKVF